MAAGGAGTALEREMVMLLQIVDWDLHFENDRSRTRDRCSWLCVPNKQHGMGFSYLMKEPDGTAIYGMFHLILGACSQQRKPRQGYLTDDGTATGQPWTADDLFVKFRRPPEEINRAIEVLISKKIGWLRDAALPPHSPPTDCPQTANSNGATELVQVTGNSGTSDEKRPSPAALTADSPPTHLEGKGIEEKGREGKEGNAAPPPDRNFPEAEWPTLEQVLAFCLRATPELIPQEIGKKFWEHYEKVRLPKWTTSSGQHFQWQGKLRAWALDESRNGAGGGIGGGEKNRPDWAKQKDALARIGQLNELIEKSPANRESVWHQANATEADRAQLKKWRAELTNLRRGNG